VPCPGTQAAARPILSLGEAFVRTVRHFWPDLNVWLDRIPDPRFQPRIIYDRRFLVWWGLSLYLFQLRARRQLDFELDRRGTEVLTNLNRLAKTKQTTRPVHDTLDYFVGRTGSAPYAWLRGCLVQRLIRMKTLDAARLQGRFVVALDATGHLVFRDKHCPRCLEYRQATHTVYLHQVLEAKLLGPADTVLSMATEFIENQDDDATLPADQRKQDCELKALTRLMPTLRREHPQLRLCLSGDALYACGRTLQLAKEHDCSYVLVFKEGQLPAVWADFQSLLPLCPKNILEHRPVAGVHQVYRWVHDLSYQDGEGRTWTFHAIQCQETVDQETTTFAWITDLHVSACTVVEVATKGGRQRWHIENQGFNRQKNSGMNLEHAFCIRPESIKAYYYLMQIAHMILQLFEASSLLRRLAAECDRTPWQLFGGMNNIVRRLLESLRYCVWGDEAFDPDPRQRMQIRLDSS
jgi:hypothetical protein